jgi:restriction endonuclease S subunit
MKSNYKKLGDFIQQVKKRNNDNILTVDNLRGINISKEFMPSVANVTGTDLSVYKVVEKNQFAYNPMHVGRDEVLPISMLVNEDKVIVSPAYVIFEIVDTDKLLSEYLMIWCRRREFDRNAWFTTDSSVRGGFNWEDFCDLELPVPTLEKQKEIIKEYHTITDRIKLNEQLNKKLEDTAQSIYKEWFVNFEFPDENGKPYKSNGGGFMMNSQEMETAVRLGLDLTVIILNDNAYGMIKWKQTGMGFESFGLDLGNPDFVKYAESYGAHGYRPKSVEEFEATLEKCVNSKGVHLIDLAVDYSLNHAILNELLPQKTCLV